MELTAITYKGRSSGYTARLGKRVYEFEWQKSLGVGWKPDEVSREHALVLANRRDKRGKKLFFVE